MVWHDVAIERRLKFFCPLSFSRLAPAAVPAKKLDPRCLQRSTVHLSGFPSIHCIAGHFDACAERMMNDVNGEQSTQPTLPIPLRHLKRMSSLGQSEYSTYTTCIHTSYTCIKYSCSYGMRMASFYRLLLLLLLSICMQMVLVSIRNRPLTAGAEGCVAPKIEIYLLRDERSFDVYSINKLS